MKNDNLKGSAYLFVTAFIWGIAFVAQSKGMDFMGPFSFNAVRNIMAGFVMIFIILISRLINKNKTNNFSRKDLVVGGISCGLALFFASSFQQIGIKYTTVGKSGFITSLYMVITPILGIFIYKKAPSIKLWISLVIAVFGMYMLCISETLSLSKGDFWILMCAFCFAIHILVTDKFSTKAEAAKLSCIQFFVCGIVSLVPTFALETISFDAIIKSAIPLLYTSVLSSGVAYTLQIVGQKYAEPALASIVMSLESVFSALAGWIILKQVMSTKEILGCILVFTAVILVQIPIMNKKEFR